MPRSGWFGRPLFGPRSDSVACVLSGGGARGSFQMGALQYLYAHDDRFRPSTFVGASAGSIIAATLAQSTDRAAQSAALDRLADVWLAMRTSDEMFTPRPWLAKAQSEAPGWMELLNPSPAATPSPRPSRFSFLRTTTTTSVTDPSAEVDIAPDPLALALAPDEDVRGEWSFGVLAQLAGHVGRLPKIGSDLATIRAGLEHSRSMYRPGPMLARLLDPEVFDEQRVHTSGATLRMAMVALESGELRFMREDGRLVDRNDLVVDNTSYGLATGTLASCAIPGVFRPVPLGDETYIDGGARENLPTQFAVEQLASERTYVVSSQTSGVRPRSSMAASDMFSVVMRATEILMDESGRDEMEYSRHVSAITIYPEVDVHEAMTVHPGLMRINSDYGWTRAAEAVRGAPQDDRARHRRITALRMRAVSLEEAFVQGADDARTGMKLASVKSELRDLVAATPPGFLPNGAERWACEFEGHPEPIEEVPPWRVD